MLLDHSYINFRPQTFNTVISSTANIEI